MVICLPFQPSITNNAVYIAPPAQACVTTLPTMYQHDTYFFPLHTHLAGHKHNTHSCVEALRQRLSHVKKYKRLTVTSTTTVYFTALRVALAVEDETKPKFCGVSKTVSPTSIAGNLMFEGQTYIHDAILVE